MTTNDAVAIAIARLDAWFETMRNEHGFCGPIVHWWEDCFLYSGPMVDWRYEGIICGYLTLFEGTGNSYWLDRAIVAADDACRLQLPSGKFANSSFQQGPMEGGTPHEAAVDVGLLQLAKKLRSDGNANWEQYYRVAERNLNSYYLAELWNGEAFLDQPWNQTLVPNKNATVIEALLLYEELASLDMTSYLFGAAEIILRAQVVESGPRQGGVIHLGTGDQKLSIGIYTSRCVAGLLSLYERSPEERFLTSAYEMGRFLIRLLKPNGGAFGFYPSGREIVGPTWISPCGDILRALLRLKRYMDIPETAITNLVDTLLRYQLLSGGIQTAMGLGAKGATHLPHRSRSFRDVLPVVGWCDKAFRGLALLADSQAIEPMGIYQLSESQYACNWKGRECQFIENSHEMKLLDAHKGKTLYHWEKGKSYPTLCQL